MHNHPLRFTKRFITGLAAAFSLFFLTGCDDLNITNLTPEALPANPSSIYTISTRVSAKTRNVVHDSYALQIVVDGKTYDMKPSTLGQGIWEFDYQLPAGRNEIAYYYVASYKIDHSGILRPRQEYSELLRSKIAGRYVFTLETTRGPIGAKISLVGRGFDPSDVVNFGGTPVRTVFESANALSFYVPAVDTGRNYDVSVIGAAGQSPVGSFRVDATTVDVVPSSLTLVKGRGVDLTFIINTPAPAGGLTLDVTTDIPQSVIMPEVVVPEGQTTVTVKVEGGQPGRGSLFLKGYGPSEVVIPVSAR